MNWKGIPLENYETVVNLIGALKTKTGLMVKAELDETIYEKGIAIPEQDMEEIRIKKHFFHGD